MHLTFNTAELYLTFEKPGIRLLLILMLPEPTVDQEHYNNTTVLSPISGTATCNIISHSWNIYMQYCLPYQEHLHATLYPI